MKKTVIAGATTNPSRYAFTAAHKLVENQVEIVPLGIKKGSVAGSEILDIREFPEIADVHTITMYMGEHHQRDYEDYFLSLRPERIIFNPGAENNSLWQKATEKGVEVENACTLVLLQLNDY